MPTDTPIGATRDSAAHQRLLNRGELRLSAYYYSFDPTGIEAIDRILAAVATAGKAYHHTESWHEPVEYDDKSGPTFIDLIQQMANEAAEEFRNAN